MLLGCTCRPFRYFRRDFPHVSRILRLFLFKLLTSLFRVCTKLIKIVNGFSWWWILSFACLLPENECSIAYPRMKIINSQIFAWLESTRVVFLLFLKFLKTSPSMSKQSERAKQNHPYRLVLWEFSKLSSASLSRYFKSAITDSVYTSTIHSNCGRRGGMASWSTSERAVLIRALGAVSRKPRKLFGPVKPLQHLEPGDYIAVLFT